MHMGLDPYGFVSSLNGILAQRLLRTICPQCGEDTRPSEEMLEESGIAGRDRGEFRFRAGPGCGHCRGSGYRGRRAIGEVLRLDDEMRELIAGRRPLGDLKAAAIRSGTRPLRQAALDLVRDGQTTLEEANRVTFVA